MINPEFSSRYAAAQALAREAGRRTLKLFQTSQLGTQTKRDGTPVTLADRDAEEFLRREIARLFPGDGIVGEEFGETHGTSGYRWILDPIDGTKAFVCGVPLYGTLVGVEHAGDAQIGVIEMPALDERVHACAGGGAYWQRGDAPAVPARASQIRALGEAVFCFTEESLFEARGVMAELGRLKRACRLCRGWNDCYAYALLATGRCDAVVDPKMEIWDIAALVPVVRESGGMICGWDGGPAIAAKDCVATNGYLGPAVLAAIRTE